MGLRQQHKHGSMEACFSFEWPCYQSNHLNISSPLSTSTGNPLFDYEWMILWFWHNFSPDLSDSQVKNVSIVVQLAAQFWLGIVSYLHSDYVRYSIEILATHPQFCSLYEFSCFLVITMLNKFSPAAVKSFWAFLFSWVKNAFHILYHATVSSFYFYCVLIWWWALHAASKFYHASCVLNYFIVFSNFMNLNL